MVHVMTTTTCHLQNIRATYLSFYLSIYLRFLINEQEGLYESNKKDDKQEGEKRRSRRRRKRKWRRRTKQRRRRRPIIKEKRMIANMKGRKCLKVKKRKEHDSYEPISRSMVTDERASSFLQLAISKLSSEGLLLGLTNDPLGGSNQPILGS